MKKDIIFNLIATALPIAVLQIIVLPLVNAYGGLGEYGHIVAIWSILSSIPTVAGNAICNARQLIDRQYKFANDFNKLIIYVTTIFSLLTVCVSIAYQAELDELIAIAISSILLILFNYGSVFYRLSINFKYTLIANILLSLGYLLGFFLYCMTNMWYLIFIVGQGISLIFIIFTTPWRKEKCGWTLHRNQVVRISSELLFSLLLAGIANYGDRLILVPLAGNEVLSIYYISSLVGKLMSMAAGPTATVLLSYLVRKESIEKLPLKKLMKIALLMSLLFWAMACILSYPILSLIYPNEYFIALHYVPITAAASVFVSMCSLFNSILLRFAKTVLQVALNAVYLGILLVVSTFLFFSFGLLGFCFGILAASLTKFVLIIFFIARAKSALSNK